MQLTEPWLRGGDKTFAAGCLAMFGISDDAPLQGLHRKRAGRDLQGAGGVLRQQAEKHMKAGVVALWKILARVHLPAISPKRVLQASATAIRQQASQYHSL